MIVSGVTGLWLGLWLGIIAHEGGHYLCARLCQIPVRIVRFSAGPLLAQWRVKETEFELGLLPYGGYVTPFPMLDYHRGKWAIFVMGGLIANIGMLFFTRLRTY